MTDELSKWKRAAIIAAARAHPDDLSDRPNPHEDPEEYARLLNATARADERQAGD